MPDFSSYYIMAQHILVSSGIAGVAVAIGNEALKTTVSEFVKKLLAHKPAVNLAVEKVKTLPADADKTTILAQKLEEASQQDAEIQQIASSWTQLIEDQQSHEEKIQRLEQKGLQEMHTLLVEKASFLQQRHERDPNNFTVYKDLKETELKLKRVSELLGN